ncbi:MAG: glycosyltransferase family 2 protein [Phycisphaerales bacterium]|nr:glycosyltransferase family 2 protein [Phycisphaerales bacterium]
MNQPLISIVLPTLRRAHCLGRAIESVLNQTYATWELVIVDGESNDGTRELVAGFNGRADGRLQFIEQANGGVGPARNIGINAARGHYIAFLDSDDEFLPTKLERQLALIRLRPELGLIYGDYSFVDLNGRFHRSTFDELAPLARLVPSVAVGPGLRFCGGELFEYLIRQYFIATIVGLVRRDVLSDEIRFWEQDMYGGEWLFYLDVCRRCPAGYVDEPLCLHHFTAGSLSRTSRYRNSVYLRRLLRIMRGRFSDASPASRGHIRRQLSDVCRQLGYDSYRCREFGSATRYFAEAVTGQCDWRTLTAVAASAGRVLTTMGRPGDEPLLRPGCDPLPS